MAHNIDIEKWIYNLQKHSVVEYRAIANPAKGGLRSIPVSGTVDWKDGHELKENIDFTIGVHSLNNDISGIRDVAIPIKQEQPHPLQAVIDGIDKIDKILFPENQSQEQPKPRYVVSGGLKPVDEVGGKGLEIHDQFEQPQQEVPYKGYYLESAANRRWDENHASERIAFKQGAKFILDWQPKQEAIEDGWISVEDRLPETDDYVLAFERGRIGISYYRNAIGGWGGKDLYCTHWQPLPLPPKK